MNKGLMVAVILSLLTASVISVLSYFIQVKENQLQIQYLEKYIEKHIGDVKSSQHDNKQVLDGVKSEVRKLQQTQRQAPLKENNDISSFSQEIDDIKETNEHILKTLIESKLIFARSHPKADLYSASAKAKLLLMSANEILALSGFIKEQYTKIIALPEDTDLTTREIRSGWYHYRTDNINKIIKKHDLSILDLKTYCQIAGLFS